MRRAGARIVALRHCPTGNRRAAIAALFRLSEDQNEISIFVFLGCLRRCEFSRSGRAYGHGFAGARFFPATLSTDDPFVSDELSLPTVSTIRTADDGGTRETDISMDLSKRITPEFAIEIGDTFTGLNPHDGPAVNGFGNLELGGKYQFLKNGEHEAIVSIGLGMEVGGTGSRSLGADSFSTWTPGIFFGKGFGDLPEALRFLKPFALTGQAGIAIPLARARAVSPWMPRPANGD